MTKPTEEEMLTELEAALAIYQSFDEHLLFGLPLTRMLLRQRIDALTALLARAKGTLH